MVTVQGRQIVGAGTARVQFGPFKREDVLIGLHVMSAYNGAGVLPVTFAAAGATEFIPGVAAAQFAALEQFFGSDGAGGFNAAIPPGVPVFVPLDLEFDRYSWLLVEITNADADTVDVTVGIERAVDQISIVA